MVSMGRWAAEAAATELLQRVCDFEVGSHAASTHRVSLDCGAVVTVTFSYHLSITRNHSPVRRVGSQVGAIAAAESRTDRAAKVVEQCRYSSPSISFHLRPHFCVWVG